MEFPLGASFPPSFLGTDITRLPLYFTVKYTNDIELLVLCSMLDLLLPDAETIALGMMMG